MSEVSTPPFLAIPALHSAVQDQSYWSWPLRRVIVEKRPGSPDHRTLLVAAVKDRVLQTAVAAYLEPFLESEFNDASFGYRRGRGVRMAVEQVRKLFLEGYTWLVDTNIESFFDNVNRPLVLGRLATLIPDETAVRLCHLWLDYASWDGLHLTRPKLGIPQGAIVFPMLANLCLDSLDDRLVEAGVKMVRCADSLNHLHLRLKEIKTRVTRFSDGFKFIGVISSAPAIPPLFFPQSERRPLRRYQLV